VALKSAIEDFDTCTLGAIPDLLGKLHYLADLHDGRGNYAHWGMGRVFGKEAARRAMRISHTTVMTRLLRTPLRELREDLNHSAATQGTTATEFLASLETRARNALPVGSPLGAEKHFMAVLHALSALAEAQAHASHPGASPLLLPDQ
jgi:hypothetical protein